MGEVMDMADQATEPVFAGMAETAGLPKKGMYTLRAVSYTHLDVYKRQILF